jgi:chemotaxis protein CheX
MMRHPRILLIDHDHDPEFRNRVVPTLRASFVVLLENNSAEGLAIAMANKPEAVLVDLQLSDQSGLHTIKMIRESLHLRRVPIIAISSNAKKNNVISVVKAGASDFLIKSDSCAATLNAKLHRILNMKKSGLNESNNNSDGSLEGVSLSKSLKNSRSFECSYDPKIEIPSGTTRLMLHMTAPDCDESAETTEVEKQAIEHWINPFIRHTSIVFQRLMGWKLKRLDIEMKETFVPTYEVSAVILIHGIHPGALVLSLSRKVAFDILRATRMTKVSEINEEVIDVVGELANIIAGRASSDLSKSHTRLGLPTVMVGHTKIAPFPTGSKPVCVSFQSEGGPLTLEVGLDLNSFSLNPVVAEEEPVTQAATINANS